MSNVYRVPVDVEPWEFAPGKPESEDRDARMYSWKKEKSYISVFHQRICSNFTN